MAKFPIPPEPGKEKRLKREPGCDLEFALLLLPRWVARGVTAVGSPFPSPHNNRVKVMLGITGTGQCLGSRVSLQNTEAQ